MDYTLEIFVAGLFVVAFVVFIGRKAHEFGNSRVNDHPDARSAPASRERSRNSRS